MKILSAIIKTLLSMAFIAFCAVIATFFVAVFNPDGVSRAIEIIKGVFS